MSKPMYVLLVTHSDGVEPQLRLFTDPDAATLAMTKDAIEERHIQVCELNHVATLTLMDTTRNEDDVLETATISLTYYDEQNKKHTYDWLVQAVTPED